MSKRLFQVSGNDPLRMIAGRLGGIMDRVGDAINEKVVGSVIGAYHSIKEAGVGLMAIGSSLSGGLGETNSPDTPVQHTSTEHASAMQKLEAALGVQNTQEIEGPAESPSLETAQGKDKGFSRADWELAEALRNRGKDTENV